MKSPSLSIMHTLPLISGTEVACSHHLRSNIKEAMGTIKPSVTFDCIYYCWISLSITDASEIIIWKQNQRSIFTQNLQFRAFILIFYLLEKGQPSWTTHFWESHCFYDEQNFSYIRGKRTAGIISSSETYETEFQLTHAEVTAERTCWNAFCWPQQLTLLSVVKSYIQSDFINQTALYRKKIFSLGQPLTKMEQL